MSPVRRVLAAALVLCAALAIGQSPGGLLDSAAAATVTPVPGDPLTGSGAVNRSLLTYAQLMSGTSTAPVSDGAFALPAQAAPPTHTFEGTLTLSGEATGGGFDELRDDFSYTPAVADSPWKHLPEIDLQFVQNGSHLIPARPGLLYTGATTWNLVAGNGRVWNENTDNGYTRAAFPLALVERNANCVHNGVLTFLFTDTAISQVRYQVTQETCMYFKFDMWGQLAATYTPAAVPGAEALKNGYAAEVAGRLPTKPISALATDYPGVDVTKYGNGVTPADMTAYGLFINGTNYVSGCTTRFGSYAFCEHMLMPSYSTAKSAFASLALMRLGQTHGAGIYNERIRDYVPETASAYGDWSTVTFDDTIDMATGNYRWAGYEVDEGGRTMSNFFTAEPYATKMSTALSFPAKTAPGSLWVYHSSDTFVLTRALGNYLKAKTGAADLYTTMRDEVYEPIGLSAGTLSTERTDNSPTGVPFGGYGLFWTRDDIAKVTKLLNADGGRSGTTQLLNASMLADSMQKDAGDRGLNTTGSPSFKYNNGFWAKQFTSADDPAYTCSFYVPFMSGYGGITVAMMPNGGAYYYFSDNNEFSWAAAVNESDKIRSQCNP
ncbi:hypothetical protein [Spirillospora sp. NPDC048819]|uniref:hypothetical protein n=1 Tax=Spirillospora sp. NPDC048819 TaxID=3155268 RepID=UPI0033E736D2